MQGKGDIARPGRHLAPHQLAHHLGVALYRGTLEGWQDRPTPGQVLITIEQHERAGAHDRHDRRPALSWAQHLGVRGEEQLDLLRIREKHKRRQPHGGKREAAAVAFTAQLQVAKRVPPKEEGLHRRGQTRTRRQFAASDALGGSEPRGAGRSPVLGSRQRAGHRRFATLAVGAKAVSRAIPRSAPGCGSPRG